MKTTTSIDIRRAADRGETSIGWLHSRHSFSFGQYRDPDRMGFRALRVINDDIVEPGAGFGEHGHKDMEIISWVLSGALEHRDSTGSGGVIRPGDLQVMSAGSGIRHSEMNGSDAEQVHFLQVWIEPAEIGIQPAYDQRTFPADARQRAWQVLVSPDGRDGSMRIHQNATLSVTELRAGQSIDVNVPASRFGYLHVAFGEIKVGDVILHSGDAISFEGEAAITIDAKENSQVLLFDLS